MSRTEFRADIRRAAKISQACATAFLLAAGVTFFAVSSFRMGVVEHRFRQLLLQLGVLRLERPQPAIVRHAHPAELRLPLVKRRRADAALAAHFGCHHAPTAALADRDGLFFTEPTALHVRLPQGTTDSTSVSLTFRGSGQENESNLVRQLAHNLDGDAGCSGDALSVVGTVTEGVGEERGELTRRAQQHPAAVTVMDVGWMRLDQERARFPN